MIDLGTACCVTIPVRLRAFLMASRLVQLSLSCMNHIGVDKSAYSKIEKGTRSLTVDELQKMVQLFLN